MATGDKSLFLPLWSPSTLLIVWWINVSACFSSASFCSILVYSAEGYKRGVVVRLG